MSMRERFNAYRSQAAERQMARCTDSYLGYVACDAEDYLARHVRELEIRELWLRHFAVPNYTHHATVKSKIIDVVQNRVEAVGLENYIVTDEQLSLLPPAELAHAAPELDKAIIAARPGPDDLLIVFRSLRYQTHHMAA